jgi:hypothetical protein
MAPYFGRYRVDTPFYFPAPAYRLAGNSLYSDCVSPSGLAVNSQYLYQREPMIMDDRSRYAGHLRPRPRYVTMLYIYGNA